MSKLEVDPEDLRILFNLAARADAAGLAGRCTADPCPNCTALERTYVMLHRAGIVTELEFPDQR